MNLSNLPRAMLRCYNRGPGAKGGVSVCVCVVMVCGVWGGGGANHI